jgi:hypothetical protein
VTLARPRRDSRDFRVLNHKPLNNECKLYVSRKKEITSEEVVPNIDDRCRLFRKTHPQNSISIKMFQFSKHV